MSTTYNGKIIVPWPKEFSHFKDRDFEWLWRHLCPIMDVQDDGSYSPLQKQTIITDAIYGKTNRTELSVDNIIRIHAERVVPVTYIEWIDLDDHRLLIWLMLKGFYFLRIENNIPTEQRFKKIITFFDNSNDTVGNKIITLNNIKNEWVKIKTPDKNTKWLDVNDSVQINWAYDYLNKKGNLVKVAAPVNNKERHAIILVSLDMIFYEGVYEKADFLRKISSAWAQVKHRTDGRQKKPHHLPLSIKAKKQLAELAELFNKKESDLVERLLAEEYTKTMLDEHGRKKY